jgi:hypothetical protein
VKNVDWKPSRKNTESCNLPLLNWKHEKNCLLSPFLQANQGKTLSKKIISKECVGVLALFMLRYWNDHGHDQKSASKNVAFYISKEQKPGTDIHTYLLFICIDYRNIMHLNYKEQGTLVSETESPGFKSLWFYLRDG